METSPRYIIGIDEAGRGPLAGPLTVGAVQIPAEFVSEVTHGLTKDSKQLTAEEREEWFLRCQSFVKEGKLIFDTASITHTFIDTFGLTLSTKRAIARLLSKFRPEPRETKIFLDGLLHAPRKFIHQETVIHGDETVPVIGLASIIAKVTRDRFMMHISKKYPLYGFEKHKGYATEEHYLNLEKFGPCAIHRRRFLRNFDVKVKA